MSSTSIVALVAVLSAPTLLFAQATDVSPVVVTATLIPTPIDQVGSSITLITAQDIQDHQWRTVPDALQEIPGINVVQTGGPGGVTSVFIRGANSNHTKVLIDGIEVNDPSANDAFDFGQALTGGLARMEVLRGPQSSPLRLGRARRRDQYHHPPRPRRPPARHDGRGRIVRHLQPERGGERLGEAV